MSGPEEDLTIAKLHELVFVLMDSARKGVKASEDCFVNAISRPYDNESIALTNAGAAALTAATSAGEVGVNLLRELRLRSKP